MEVGFVTGHRIDPQEMFHENLLDCSNRIVWNEIYGPNKAGNLVSYSERHVAISYDYELGFSGMEGPITSRRGGKERECREGDKV